MENINMVHSGTIKHEGVSQPKVELTRYQKGGYGWVISAGGSDLPAVITAIKEADAQLQQAFPPTEGA